MADAALTKTFEYNLDGASFRADLFLNEQGTVVAKITMLEGSADFNSMFWGDDDELNGDFAFRGNDANLNITPGMHCQDVKWDGGYKLGSPQQNPDIAHGKDTFLEAGEVGFIELTGVTSLDQVDVFGIHGTNASTPDGEINAVAGEGIPATCDDDTDTGGDDDSCDNDNDDDHGGHHGGHHGGGKDDDDDHHGGHFGGIFGGGHHGGGKGGHGGGRGDDKDCDDDRDNDDDNNDGGHDGWGGNGGWGKPQHGKGGWGRNDRDNDRDDRDDDQDGGRDCDTGDKGGFGGKGGWGGKGGSKFGGHNDGAKFFENFVKTFGSVKDCGRDEDDKDQNDDDQHDDHGKEWDCFL